MNAVIKPAMMARRYARARLVGDQATMALVVARVPDVEHRCVVCGARLATPGVVGPACEARARRNGLSTLIDAARAAA